MTKARWSDRIDELPKKKREAKLKKISKKVLDKRNEMRYNK